MGERSSAGAGRLRRGAFALLLISLPAVAPGTGIVVTDDVGREVTVAGPARRIVSLSPHITELLFELEIGDRVVGTVRFSDYPEEARSIQRLGDAFSLNVELLLELDPDLVVAWYSGGSSRAVSKVMSLGIPVYFSEAATLEAIAGSAERIGRLAGVEERARVSAAGYLKELEEIRGRYSDSSRVRVFYQMSEVNLFTVNDEHLIGQAIALCGGDNIFGPSPVNVFQVSREAVVAARPDLILFTGSDEERRAGRWAAEWKPFAQIPAVRHGRLRALSPDILTRPSFRMLHGIAALCSEIDEVRPGGAPE